MLKTYRIALSAFVMMALASIPLLAVAAGIQVSPAQLNISGPGGKVMHQNIIVANPTTDVQLFEISADEFDKNIRPNPASFTLEAGSRKTIVLDITPMANQQLSTTLSIVGHPLVDARLQTNTGVKIPITVSAAAKKPIPWWVWAAIGAAALLGGVWLGRKGLPLHFRFS